MKKVVVSVWFGRRLSVVGHRIYNTDEKRTNRRDVDDERVQEVSVEFNVNVLQDITQTALVRIQRQ